MTNAPADLLTLRSAVRSKTGLSADDTGIVGNVQHDCGYHIGRGDLINRGCLHLNRAAGDSREDYSVRLGRDRAGVTDSSSAFDLGSSWNQGRAAWLRFNQLLLANLLNRVGQLAAVRAVNISTDGVTKHRYDRESGFAVQSTNDTVTIHTHFEFYRDTEGQPARAAAIAYIESLVDAAISGAVVVVAHPPAAGGLAVDGKLGPDTIRAWQRVMGTPQDGVISASHSDLVAAVQRHLNAHDHAGLVVDGQGIQQGGPASHTARALQHYLGTPQDGVISAPVSDVVKALQGRLNLGWF